MSVLIEDLRYVYAPGTPFAKTALDGVNLEIPDREWVGIAGATGSGKTTLIQHLNGLLRQTAGTVVVNGTDFGALKKIPVAVRAAVGMVFQYPEHQLFESSVYDEIAFGPRNLGLSEEVVAARVREAMELLELDYRSFKNRVPFHLSGGERRRVAIAGVLAMRPQLLVLDEPTAGMDPGARKSFINRMRQLHREQNITIIWVSHNMNEIAGLVDRLVVMQDGRIIKTGPPRQVFAAAAEIRAAGLEIPAVTDLAQKLAARGEKISPDLVDQDEAFDEISRLLRCRHD
ncbi:MAG: energy-coupling factor transporter ATPase [Bacillota bacterium]